MKACNFIIKRLQHRCIPVNTTKCFRQFFYRTHLVTASAYNALKIRKLKQGYISQILGVVAFENALQTKICSKSTTKKQLLQLMLFGGLWISLNMIFDVCDRQFLIQIQAFDINDSGGVSYYLQTVMESVLVRIQTFTINGSDGVSYVPTSGQLKTGCFERSHYISETA